MTEIAKKVGQYVVLVAITVFACGVMWYVSSRSNGAKDEDSIAEPPGIVAQPRALVAVDVIEPELTEITVRHSGKIRAWETYSLGFEVAGRVQSLGTSKAGQPLDDGHRVEAGQVLARLDDRIYSARKSEAIAQLEQATSDLKRDRRLFESGRGAVTEAAYQDTLTRMAIAKAAHEVAVKNLEDTALIAPIAGAISRRLVEPGESVMANTVVFEIVENHRLLLVVDVPESRIRELQERMRQANRAKADASITDPEEKAFRARVNLEGRDAFGNRWPSIEAEVYRIAQVADERTKLFEVEVMIDNSDGLLRPGMVATTDLVINRLMAYRAPDSAVIFRSGSAYLFTVETEPTDVQTIFWNVGQTGLPSAQRVDLKRWIDQGERIIIPAEDVTLGPVVTRGQQRLSTGQHVRVVNAEEMKPPARTASAAKAAVSPPPQEEG